MDTSYLPASSPKLHRAFTAAFVFVLAGWVGAGAMSFAQADTGPPAVQSEESVRYGDLDLSTETGARQLLSRIDKAARRICGPEPVTSSLIPRSAALHDKCVIVAVDQAVSRIGAPLLTAMRNQDQAGVSGGASLAAR